MAFKTGNRVRETTSTTGVDLYLVLTGAVAGHKAWSAIAGIANADAVYYCAVAANGQWEVGRGYYLTGPGRIWRNSPLDGSSGAGVTVNFAQAPEVFCTMLAEDSRSRGAFAKVTMSANQVIGSPTFGAKILFNTLVANSQSGNAANTGWEVSTSKGGGYNEPGWYEVSAKIDAVATFAGESFIAIATGAGAELARGPIASDAKSLWVRSEVYMGHFDECQVQITCAGGGEILSTAARSYLTYKFVPNRLP